MVRKLRLRAGAIIVVLLATLSGFSDNPHPVQAGCPMTTPAWIAPINNQTFSTSHIQQFLALHGVTCIYKGSSIVQTQGYHGSNYTSVTNNSPSQSLANIQVDQPFTMSGTTISRAEIPIQIADGNGQDVTVGLYADDGTGSHFPTGSAIVSTTIPREFLASAQNLNPIGLTSSFNTNALIPSLTIPAPINQYQSPGVATDGNNWVTIGGFLSTVGFTPNVFTTQTIASGGFTTWQGQPAYPTATNYVSAVIAGNYVVGVGGQINAASLSSVYTSAIDGSASLGAWISQTAYPTTIDAAAIAYSATYSKIYVIGGYTGSVYTNAVYSATITNGTISAWTAESSLPVSVDLSSAVISNGYLVVAGGLGATTVSNVYAAKIGSTGTLGPWLLWPSLPAVRNSGLLTAYTNGLYYIGGQSDSTTASNTMYFLPLTSTGTPADTWSTIPILSTALTPNQISMSNTLASGSLMQWPSFYDFFASVIGGSTKGYNFPLISVPLAASGLSNGTRYHLVVSGSSNTTQTGVQDSSVPLVESITGGGGFTGNTKTGSGSWTALTATVGMPMNLFSGNTGRLIHTMEDITAGTPINWNWIIQDYFGNIRALGECQGSHIHSFRTLGVDSAGSGLPTGTT